MAFRPLPPREVRIARYNVILKRSHEACAPHGLPTETVCRRSLDWIEASCYVGASNVGALPGHTYRMDRIDA